MEALEFLKEAKRMCMAIGCCSDCSLGYGCAIDGVKNIPDIALESNCLVVEQWSKEHPIITNAKKFEEVFGYTVQEATLCEYLSAWWNEPYKEP